MARWQLTEKHYLNVPGTKWEFQTVDRGTGRPSRKSFNVPLYLDPEDKDSWNYRGEGMYEDGTIIVCHEGKGQPRDIIFVGDPTPGMLPLDDEAKAISGKFNWTPTQGLDEESQSNSFSQKLLLGIIDQMSDIQSKAAAAQSTIPGMEQFMGAMTQMMAQQTAILAAFAKPRPVATPHPAQIVDIEEPLPDADAPTPEEIAAAQQAYDAGQKASAEKATADLARRTHRRL